MHSNDLRKRRESKRDSRRRPECKQRPHDHCAGDIPEEVRLLDPVLNKAEPDKPEPAKKGNRCGHVKGEYRTLSDRIRRGKGGHPPIVGQIVALLDRVALKESLLAIWQKMNRSGRRRRSEMREDAAPAVIQYLILSSFDITTRRCAISNGEFLSAPDVKTICNGVNKMGRWRHDPISEARVKKVLADLVSCGYMTSKQKRTRSDNGSWSASPAIRTFTKLFFLELGGPKLWEALKKQGKKKGAQMLRKAQGIGVAISQFLNPGPIYTPREAQRLQRGRRNPEWKALYRRIHDRLRTLYGGPGPPEARWQIAEIADNARRIADKEYGLA